MPYTIYEKARALRKPRLPILEYGAPMDHKADVYSVKARADKRRLCLAHILLSRTVVIFE